MSCGSKGFTRPAQGALNPQDAIHRSENAVDIEASEGSPVVACVAGTVLFAISGLPNAPSNQQIPIPSPIGSGRWGNCVVIAGEDGCFYLTAHLEDAFVSTGDYVTQGQEIGLVGQSGHATGPHTHFQVAGSTDVMTLLAGSQYQGPTKGTLVGSTSSTSSKSSSASADAVQTVFGFPLMSYLKVAGGGILLFIAILFILAAAGLRSGTAESAVTKVPIVGPTLKLAKGKRSESQRAKRTNLREQQASQIREQRTAERSEAAYRTAVARRRGKEGLTRGGESYAD